MNAVIKLINSQGKRNLMDCSSVVSKLSSLDTPPISKISSLYSSTITSIISSTVTIPRIAMRWFTTGIAFKSYLDTSFATSSWSISGPTLMKFSFVISAIIIFLSEDKISRKSAVPINCPLALTTKIVSITSILGPISRIFSSPSITFKSSLIAM